MGMRIVKSTFAVGLCLFIYYLLGIREIPFFLVIAALQGLQQYQREVKEVAVRNVVGTLIGFFAVSLSTAILPFALAFAGGTMLYVISDEMIPETHHDNESGATYALLVGFCVMLISDVLLG